MPVAKSYANMEIQGEPFCENKRMYVNVLAPKGIKKVRWYSDAEYRKMYPDAPIADIMDFNGREAFGFGQEGFITLYKGHPTEEWFEDEHRNLRYNLIFGYYTPGRLELPSLIGDIVPVRLNWEDVATEGNKMKPHEEVIKIVKSKLK